MEETVKPAKSAYSLEVDKLKQKTRELKDSFTNQLNQLTTDTNQAIKVGAIALGVAIGGYIVYRLVSSGGGKKKKYRESSEGSLPVAPERGGFDIVDMIKSAIATFILSIARERIIQFIERVNQKSDDATASADSVTTAN